MPVHIKNTLLRRFRFETIHERKFWLCQKQGMYLMNQKDMLLKMVALALTTLLLIFGCTAYRGDAYMFETGGQTVGTDASVKSESGMYRGPSSDSVRPSNSDLTISDRYPETVLNTEPETIPVTEAPATEPPHTEPPQTDPPQTEPPQTDPPQTEPPQTEPPQTEPPQTEPPVTEPPVTEPPETDPPAPSYDYTRPVPLSDAVDGSFFKSAAFIGDSLTVGLMWQADWDAVRVSKVGASLFGIVRQIETVNITEVLTDDPKGRYNISESVTNGLSGTVTYYSLLKRLGNPERIYICLGANDLRISHVSNFESYYRQLLQDLKSWYPNAEIYVGSVLPIADKNAAERFAWLEKYDDVGGNDRVFIMNEVLRRVCRQESVYYLDVHSALINDEGYLRTDYASDGMHLTSLGYETWKKYLMTHVVKD